MNRESTSSAEHGRPRALGAVTSSRVGDRGGPSERLSLSDRFLEWLGDLATKRVVRDGGAERLCTEAVRVEGGRCPFCRQRWSLYEAEHEEFCGDCRAANVTSDDYWEMIAFLRLLRDRRMGSQGLTVPP